MKNINQYIDIAKKTYNNAPLFSLIEMEDICKNSPSIDIGEINLKANIFRKYLMRILSIAAAGALILALYLIDMLQETQESADNIVFKIPEPEQILAEAMVKKTLPNSQKKRNNNLVDNEIFFFA